MSKHIEALKRFKPPLWSRLLGRWRRYIEKYRPQHVACLKFYTIRPVAFGNGKRVMICSSLHLYENGAGDRWVKWYPGYDGISYKKFRDFYAYVMPWLKGDPDAHTVVLQYERESQVWPTHAKGKWT